MEGRSQLYDTLLADAGLGAADDAERRYLWQIVDEGALGASKHVALSQDLMRYILESASPDDLVAPDDGQDATAVRRARLAGDAIARTRGVDAPVVANAIAWLTAGLDTHPAPERAQILSDRMARWQEDASRRSERPADGAQALAPTAGRSWPVARGCSCSTIPAPSRPWRVPSPIRVPPSVW